MDNSASLSPSWKDKIEHFMANPWIQHGLIFLIVVNAAILGIETSPSATEAIGPALHAVDHVILWIFVAELVLLIAARGIRFFRDPWSVFDFIVIAIAFVPATGSLSVLRALRVLRVLRLINKVESMRVVVAALLHSLPGLGSVFGLIMIIFYVAGVIATNLFSHDFPDKFGSLYHTLFTLFQVMTLEGWSEDIARPVMEVFPNAWVFFVLFVLIATFVVINLFVAVIVDSISKVQNDVSAAEGADSVATELQALRTELASIKSMLKEHR